MTLKRTAIVLAAAFGIGYFAAAAFGASALGTPGARPAEPVRPAATVVELNPCAMGACW